VPTLPASHEEKREELISRISRLNERMEDDQALIGAAQQGIKQLMDFMKADRRPPTCLFDAFERRPKLRTMHETALALTEVHLAHAEYELAELDKDTAQGWV